MKKSIKFVIGSLLAFCCFSKKAVAANELVKNFYAGQTGFDKLKIGSAIAELRGDTGAGESGDTDTSY